MPRMLEDSPELLEKVRNAKIVYTDLDGTMLGRGGTLLIDPTGTSSLTVAETIVEANLAGVHIVPVSGRSRLQMTEIVRMVGWQDFIAEAGGIRTYWDGSDREIVFDLPEWKFELGDMLPLEIIRAAGVLEALQEEFPGRIEYHSPWHHSRETTDVYRGFIDRQRALEILDALPIPVSIIDNGVIHPKKHTLKESDEPIRVYHLAPAGVSKRRAIALDLERRGIDPQDAIMIGDSPSDMHCAEVVGAAILVKNALKSPGLEKRLEYIPNAAIVDGCIGDGWSKTIRYILDARK